MEIGTIKKIEKMTVESYRVDYIRPGLAVLFMLMALAYGYISSIDTPNNIFLAIAVLFGAYMAMNIGANDVANNVGPAVGSKALTMGGAIAIAAIFETAGALIAGGDVVKTIKNGIISVSAFNGNTDSFIWAMMAALLAAALWLNFATIIKAPVSTTHSIVGGVMGAGIAAAGFHIVSWTTMLKIAASWITSPIMGAIIAALFLITIKKTIVFKEDKIKAALVWVPIFVSIMSWAFVTYLTLKGLKKIWPNVIDIFIFLPDSNEPTFMFGLTLGLMVAIVVYFILKKTIIKKVHNIENSKDGINKLFTVPLIFAAALLSFAHGANDVANAIGPLAAISDAVMTGGISSATGIPLWIMGVGAIGIALGLALYGPKLIRTVGSEITELDQIRAYSIAMAASITVIIASGLGLPVSSTHVAIGGIFGVGFLREYLDNTGAKNGVKQNEKNVLAEKDLIKKYVTQLNELEKKENKKKKDYRLIVRLYQIIKDESIVYREAKKQLKSSEKIRYVKRDILKKIVAAWLITVPAAALISALIYYALKGMLL
ncbi:MAG: inorganic phosphate transporter [Sulfurospirillum sp.]|nr:inorganic phosphate transporter [Sulfurospirillum sp.]MBL0703844.1 inorganic phosphate transporter [Sulfurospirillum sp.]